jgi:Tfp pilus assembly protein PilN
MIRTNLATRPFYNERAVRLWLLLGTIAVLAATAFNVSQVLRYSNSNTELATRAANDEARAAELRTRAQRQRASVDVAEVESVAVDASQANDLIDRRTFSWTELFNRFEQTLPANVRIMAVRPTVDRDRRIVLTVVVLARGVDDVNEFMENLDATGAFLELRSAQEQTTDEGQIQSTLETVYKPPPPAAEPRPASTATSGGPR